MTQRLARGMHVAKADGYIIPGLTLAELDPLWTALRNRRTAPTALVAPLNSNAQIALACQDTEGSMYRSITRIRDTTLAALGTWVARDRLHTPLPIELESRTPRRHNVEAVGQVILAVFASSRLIGELYSVLPEECITMTSEFVARPPGRTRGPT